MNAKFIALAALTAVTFAQTARAIDVYAYKDGSYKAVGSTLDMRKVITGAELTQIISSKGDTLTLENAAFSYILFHPKTIATGIARAAKPQGLTISYDNGAIRIDAPEKLRSISIYSADGSKAAGIADAQSQDVVLSTLGLPAGVYVVEAVTASGKKANKKIVKR